MTHHRHAVEGRKIVARTSSSCRRAQEPLRPRRVGAHHICCGAARHACVCGGCGGHGCSVDAQQRRFLCSDTLTAS
eukprot:6196408-Pleurochrysis_carterae.AAC.1